MQREGMDASKDVTIFTPILFETAEQCQYRLRTMHQDIVGSSLKWDKTTEPYQLYLLSEGKASIWKCVPTWQP